METLFAGLAITAGLAALFVVFPWLLMFWPGFDAFK
jgi:hypothetical protein